MIKIIKILGIALVVVGVSYPFIQTSKRAIVNYQYEKTVDQHIEDNNYYGILVIDKINLKREFYPIDSTENQVDKNIFLHNSSKMPGSKYGSNLILAGHSGSGAHAYFKDLYLLEVNDEIQVYYQGSILTYVIMEIEYQDKTGILYLKEDYMDMITLITCTKDDSSKQTIYYGVLKSRQKI